MQTTKLRSRLGALAVGLAFTGLAAPPGEAGVWRPSAMATPTPRVAGRDAAATCRDFVDEHRDALGLAQRDTAELHATSTHRDPRTGTSYVYLRQQLHGLPVHGGELAGAVDARGHVTTLGDHLVRALDARCETTAPVLGARAALLAAAAHLDLDAGAIVEHGTPAPAPTHRAHFDAPGLSRERVPVELAYVRTDDDRVRLAWTLVARTPDGRHWWNLFVDAVTGDVLRAYDWMSRDSYTVVPLPLESLDEGPRATEVDVAEPVASPFGWHDTNGIAGPESFETVGNNVTAQEDGSGDDGIGLRPNGGSGLVFDPPLDLALQPPGNFEAAVTNLFYWTNRMHDIAYHAGFDEAAGNFQQNNYGRGGAGNDPVLADALDGSGIVNNAQFATPPDGFAPRMEMFRFTQPGSAVVVQKPPELSGTRLAGNSAFGGATGANGLRGTLERALDAADAAGPSTTDGCSALTNASSMAGRIALIDRGTCTFVDKVRNAQAAGAIGAVIVNNAGDAIVSMSGFAPDVTIPAAFLGQSQGELLAASSEAVSVDLVSVASRDSSLDSTIIAHEYAHGITTRLTGGASNVNCLQAAESLAMGEGWSDWYALAVTAEPSDTAAQPRGIGTYVVAGAPGDGIRNLPYSTDLGVNARSYEQLGSLNQPHGGGEIWASALWDLYWLLVDEQGFDADLIDGNGGNNTALRLVTDALKRQPCSPTMVDGRDALLASDQALHDGAHACKIWQSFARRGLGEGASGGASAESLGDVVASTTVPVQCVPEPGAASMVCVAGVTLAALRRRRSRSGSAADRQHTRRRASLRPETEREATRRVHSPSRPSPDPPKRRTWSLPAHRFRSRSIFPRRHRRAVASRSSSC